MLLGGVTKWLGWSKTRKTLVAPLPSELSGNPRMRSLADCYNPMRLKAILDGSFFNVFGP
jgi:hypothetical protein